MNLLSSLTCHLSAKARTREAIPVQPGTVANTSVLKHSQSHNFKGSQQEFALET